MILGLSSFPDALMSGDHGAWLKRLHFIESSNPLLALRLIGRLYQMQMAAVVGGITRYDQTDGRNVKAGRAGSVGESERHTD